MNLTADRLRELLHYDPATGSWTRHVAIGRHGRYKAGAAAGGINADGYLVICIDYEDYYGHRLAWLYMTGAWPVAEVDHKNLVRHDLRWENLREASKTQNRRNRSVRKRDLPRGVHRMPERLNLRKPFWARITVNRVPLFLGYFASPDAAHAAYATAAKEYFGEFARFE